MQQKKPLNKIFLPFVASLALSTNCLAFVPPAYALDLETGYSGKISLAIPKNWKKESKLDKNVLLKASGAFGLNFAELALNQSDAEGVTPATLAQVLEESVLHKLPQFKLASNKQARFGTLGAMTGLEKTIYFAQSGTEIAQRYLFFADGGQVYFLVLTCPKDNLSSCESLWADVLRNLKTLKTNAVSSSASQTQATAAAGTAQSQTSTKLFRGEKSVEFNYPSGFESEDVDQKDHIVKLTNKSAAKFAAVDLFRGELPYNQNLETMAAALEDKYFAGEKDYRKIKEETGAIGRQGNVTALTRETTFTQNGMPMHQMLGFFRTDKWLYCLSLTTANWNANEANREWSRLTSTLKINE